jgi:hypothetical protein
VLFASERSITDYKNDHLTKQPIMVEIREKIVACLATGNRTMSAARIAEEICQPIYRVVSELKSLRRSRVVKIRRLDGHAVRLRVYRLSLTTPAHNDGPAVQEMANADYAAATPTVSA